ncbi:MAG: SDR family NAD(P)-dependent oxidoreductase [Gammaproteobacteria bacterium]|jgi:NAD(P)-dependent dehydrogenase (short-subunit alcohol dehydrogenase family)
MKNFEDKIAVVTGGGTGMGRELVCQLVAAGARVAMCDVAQENMDETRRLAGAEAGRLSDHLCDVSSEEQVLAFRDEVLAAHQTQHINLLFNNAGIGGGGSFVEGDRGEWERTFAVCWDGVYFGCRAFMEALVASDEGHIVNTSSVNGFWASLGTTQAHTSYAAAKFAVKGFTEALVTDLRLHAPHVQCSVVMPGHIGTSIMENSSKVLGKPWGHELPDEEVAVIRQRMLAAGLPVGNVPDDHIRQMLADRAEAFRTQAPTTAGEAASVILEGVRNNQWRILIGQDARDLDRLVREAPEEAYEKSFVEKLNELKHLGGLL